jgi:hypothetical protein
MPAKKSPSAKPTVKKAAKKAAPKSRTAPKTKKGAVPPSEARPFASSATRGRGQKREVVGVVSSITNDDIALRAYYISERRQHLGLPGDAQSDWLEAEKQLCS